MRRLLMLLLGISLALALAGRVAAQTDIKCTDVVKSSEDTVRVSSFKAKPGGIAKMPIFMVNRYPVGGFRLSFQYDPTKLAPIRPNPADTSEIEFHPAGRYIYTDTIYDDLNQILRIDTVSRGQSNHLPLVWSTDTLVTERYPDVVQLLSLPELITPDPGNPDTWYFAFDTVAAGRGIMAYIYFQVLPTAKQNDTILFNVFRTDLIRNITVQAGLTDTLFGGCYGTDYSAFVEGTGGVISDVPTYPTIPGGAMRLIIDSNYVEVTPPVISSFTANPTTVGTNGSSTLSWNVSNADSVIITSGASTWERGVQLIGSTSVGPLGATTTFTLTAKKGTAIETKTVTVTVTSGGTGNPPQVTTPQTTYTLTEGESVGFTVTATDPDGGNITLSCTSPSPLPNGASFTSSPGPSPRTGDLSWSTNIGQKGTYTFVFSANDGINTGTRAVTIIVNELQFDRLFSTSAPPPKGKPVGGLKGTSGVLFPINLVSAQIVYGVQFDLDYPTALIRLDSIVSTVRIPDFVVYDNIGATPGTVRVVAFGMNNETVQPDSSSAILHFAVTIDSTAQPWVPAKMILKNGRESVDPDPNVGSLPLVTDTLGIIEVDSLGDVNLDKYIDVADIVSLVGNIIGNPDIPDFTPRQFATADCMTNDTVNVFDLVADINAIYQMPFPVSPAPATNESAIVTLAYGDLNAGQSDVLTVTSEIPSSEQVAGAEMEISYDPSAVQLGRPTLTSDNQSFSLQYRDDGSGKMKVLLYQMSRSAGGRFIPGGTADLVSIPMTARQDVAAGNKSQLRLTQMLLSTPQAARISVDGVDEEPPSVLPSSFMLKQNYPNPFNPTTKIEFSIAGPTSAGMRDVKLDIYNVLGQKVRTLVNEKMTVGPHTVEWNATSDTGERIASGIYMYRLTVGAESRTRKMVFLK